MLTEEKISAIQNRKVVEYDDVDELISDWRELTAQLSSLTSAGETAAATAQQRIDALMAANKKLEDENAWAHKPITEKMAEMILKHEQELRECDAKLAALTVERDELRVTIGIISEASHRASKLWQKAHPHSNIWPDMAKAEVWLLEQNDQLRGELEAARDALKYANGFALDVWQANVPEWMKANAGITQNVCRAALQAQKS